jgi:hypothetical protein
LLCTAYGIITPDSISRKDRKMIRKIIRITSMAACLMLVLSTVFSTVTFAAGSSIYVAPASGSLQPGQSITIQVKGNLATGTFYGADTVSGTLQFPANLLKVTGVSTSGATLNWQVSATPGNGVVNFSERAFFNSDNTSVFIMSVTFQALAAGTAGLSFSSATHFSSSSYGTSFPTALTGGSYTISNPAPTTCPSGQIGTPPNCKTPPATCPAGQVGTPPNCTTPVTSCPAGQTGTPPNCKTPSAPTTSTTTPATTNTPPNASPGETATPAAVPSSSNDNGMSITDTSASRSYKTATLSWKTSIASNNTVTYGTSLKKLDQTAAVTQLPDGTYEAKLTNLTPGKQYYFTIAASGAADSTKTDSYSGVFTTKGYPVIITITASGTPVTNAKVKIGEQTYSTDKSGQLNLELASGSYDVSITSPKGSKTGAITVAAKPLSDTGNAPAAQKFSFEIPAPTDSGGGVSLFTIIGALVGGVAILALVGGLFFILKRRREQSEGTIDNPLTVDNSYTWNEAQPLPAFPQEQTPASAPIVTPNETSYGNPASMMPPEVPLAPVERTTANPEELPALAAEAEVSQTPLDTPDMNNIATPVEMNTLENTPQPEADLPTDNNETALQEESGPINSPEVTTPPPPPAPDVPIEDDAAYASPDTASTPLPPDDGEPDAEIIGSELQINHHHGTAPS